MTSCPPEQCLVADCTRNAAPGRRHCHAHQKRATRGQSLSTPVAETYATPWERLVAAALAYADAGDDEEEFARAKDRLRKAAGSYGIAEVLRKAGVKDLDELLELVRHARKTAPRGRKDRPEGQLDLWDSARPP